MSRLFTRKSIPKADQDSVSACRISGIVNTSAPSPFASTSPAGPGTDIHSLRAEDKSVNTQRSNKDFFEEE
jgi:endonuclease I